MNGWNSQMPLTANISLPVAFVCEWSISESAFVRYTQ